MPPILERSRRVPRVAFSFVCVFCLFVCLCARSCPSAAPVRRCRVALQIQYATTSLPIDLLMSEFLKSLFVDPSVVHGGRAWIASCGFLEQAAFNNSEEAGEIFIEATCEWSPILGFLVMLSHMCLYGYVLYVAADLIGTGSELLLLIPSLREIVGAVVIPVFATVPDAVLVAFATISAGETGGEEGAELLSVGIGALAGSTAMILSVPWFLSCLQGRVDIDEKGECDYRGKQVVHKGEIRVRKLTKARGCSGLFNSGMELEPVVRQLVVLEVCTGLIYFVVQVPAFMGKDKGDEEQIEYESTPVFLRRLRKLEQLCGALFLLDARTLCVRPNRLFAVWETFAFALYCRASFAKRRNPLLLTLLRRHHPHTGSCWWGESSAASTSSCTSCTAAGPRSAWCSASSATCHPRRSASRITTPTRFASRCWCLLRSYTVC